VPILVKIIPIAFVDDQIPNMVWISDYVLEGINKPLDVNDYIVG
jgi:hypothetical protein